MKAADIQSADEALSMAMEMGCSASRIMFSRNNHSSYTVRGEKLDKLQQATGSSLYIQLFTEGRYGSFSTNRIEKDELRTFIRKAIEATKLLSPDLCRTLPDTALYYKGCEDDLMQNDPAFHTIDSRSKKEMAFSCASEIYGKDRRILSVISEFSDSQEYIYMVDSQGFAKDAQETTFMLNAECSVKDNGDDRPEGWWHHQSIMFDELEKKGIGEEALRRALAKLNPKKLRSGKYNIVIENNISSRLVAPIISALNGAALQQNNSFLNGKLGIKIFPGNLQFFDNPHQKGLFGARYFDGEGIATRSMEIIKDGIISSYFINTYYSNKLKIPVTIEGPSILECALSGRQAVKLKHILKEAGKGIFITGFNGGNSNTSTGDFSFGINGFYFENGEILYPVNEMNITGNMISLWNSITHIGNDPRHTGRWLIPTLAFEHVDISGL